MIGGVITEPEAKELVLRKHHDLVGEQLSRYLDAEKRALLRVFENLWEKYVIPARDLERAQRQSNATLSGFLAKLGYEG